MRIVFCGSGAFATPSLQAILKTAHEVVGVISQPPRRAGRGGRPRATPVAELAGQAGVGLLTPPDINSEDSVKAIAQMRPDVICVAEFGQMIRLGVRQLARLDAFNLHASLLPKLRGAAPVNWAIIRGCHRTGVTTFSLVDRMDAGPIYLQAETDILPGDTAETLRARLAEIGTDVVCRTLGLLSGGWAQMREQDEARVSLAPRLKKADGQLRWSDPAETICNLIHGTWPWPGGQTTFRRQDGSDIAAIIGAVAVEPGQNPTQPGRIDADLTVDTGRGRLRILRIKPAGKRLIAWEDFVNGYRVREGDRFVSEGGGEDA